MFSFSFSVFSKQWNIIRQEILGKKSFICRINAINNHGEKLREKYKPQYKMR